MLVDRIHIVYIINIWIHVQYRRAVVLEDINIFNRNVGIKIFKLILRRRQKRDIARGSFNFKEYFTIKYFDHYGIVLNGD
jgi:hypothetical protein